MFLSALLFMTFVSASSIFLMIVMGPCVFSCGTHVRRTLLLAPAPRAGVQPGSGRWVSSLVYADDVVLLSWSSLGLQALLDGMHAFCQGLGLTISPSKTEVVVFNGTASSTWHVGQHQLP